jgi:hypothetical protein
MRSFTVRLPLRGVVAAAALLVGNAVQADIIPVFNVATEIDGGCRFSYNVSIAADSRVNKGDYFTIYDFNGYIDNSAFAPVDWSVNAQNTGVTPPGVNPNAFSGDNPGIINLTFTYTGAATLFGPVNPVGGVGAFGADSIVCAVSGLGTYASKAHKNNPGKPDNNTLQQNGGFVVTPAAVPEASSFMLLLPGLVPLGIMMRRQRRKE